MHTLVRHRMDARDDEVHLAVEAACDGKWRVPLRGFPYRPYGYASDLEQGRAMQNNLDELHAWYGGDVRREHIGSSPGGLSWNAVISGNTRPIPRVRASPTGRSDAGRLRSSPRAT